jgi:hypothetical protein
MSSGLLSQLETYFSDLDADQGPVTVDHVADLIEKVRELPAAPLPIRSRPRVWVVAVAAAVVFLVLGAIPLLFSGPEAETPPASELTTVTTLPEDVSRTTEATDVTTTPPTTVASNAITPDDRGISPTHTIAQPGGWMAGLTVYEDMLWALVQMPASSTDIDETTLFEGQILRIDPDTGTVLSRIDIGEALSWNPAIEAGEGAVWAVWGNMLLRIDSTTETVEIVTDTLVNGQDDLPGNEVHGRLAVGEGAVWLLDDVSSLIRIDPTTSTVTDTIDLQGGRRSVEVGGGYVWVLIEEESNPTDAPDGAYGRLLRIDPGTLDVTPTARIRNVLFPGSGRPLAFGEGTLWITNMGAVTRVNPTSGAISATIPVPGAGCGPLAIGFGGPMVWTATSGAWLAGIDPTTNTVAATGWIQEPEGGGGPVFNIASANNALWITRMASLLQRISIEDIAPEASGPTPCA